MKPYSAQGIGNAAGTAEADLTPPPGYVWDVYQIAVETNSTSASTCSVYINQRFYCGSNIGNQDAADGSPLTVKWSDELRVIWSGVTQGAACNVYIQVDEKAIGQ